jgi:hypothetical protein
MQQTVFRETLARQRGFRQFAQFALSVLVLLRHKATIGVRRARQHGHRGKLAMRASINRLRMVAIEFGM